MPRLLRYALSVFLFIATIPALTQTSIPPNQVSPLKDTSSLKPPPGAKVAIIEYEDLECPHCARAFPIVHEAAKHYSIPLQECDFQIEYHHWSHDAALCAHYLKAKVSPALAEEYRRELFASQFRIASQDDLHAFNEAFMTQHGQKLPFVMDPAGQFAAEIQKTTDQGKRIGIGETPSIFVVAPNGWIQVKDVTQLYTAIDQAEAATRQPAAHAARVTAHTSPRPPA